VRDVPPNYPPDYDRWPSKPCWHINEICYLAQGLDPDCMPGGIEFDEESAEVRPAPINYEAVVIAAEFLDLIKRAIESGELEPAKSGGKYFKPHDVVDYLNQKNVSLPRGVVLPHELLIAKPGFAEETEAIGGSIAQPSHEHVEQEVYDLFDPLPKDGIENIFILSADRLENKEQWSKWIFRAARNGLKQARTDCQPYQYNPAKVADWLVNNGKLDRARANRLLVKNLPPRSRDEKHLITGELE